MNARLTWRQAKPIVGQPVGLCPANEDFLNQVNEGINILWDEGDWVGKHQRYKIRITSDCRGNRCIAWPHFIETIEAISICNSPIGVRNQVFEFIENAVGQIDRSCGVQLLGDRSEHPSMNDINPGSKKLKVYIQRAEAADSQVLLLGYDDENRWIKTFVDGEWTDGEYVNLSTTPQTTTNFFSSLTGVQFFSNDRNGDTYLYEVDTLDADSERWLSTYEYYEETPVFRRSILNGLPNRRLNDDEEDSHCQCVIALVRMRFIPIQRDTDYLQISSLGSLKAILEYIYKRDNGKLQDAMNYKQEAINLLNAQLKQYNGYGAKKVMQFPKRAVIGAGRNVF